MKILQTLLLTFLTCSAFGQIIPTEIMYNPPESGTDSLEFIELYNAGGEDIDLTGYYFSDGISGTIDQGTIASKGYFVLSVNPTALQTVFGASSTAWSSGALNNGGEVVELSAPDSSVVFSFEYDDKDEWPTAPDGDGPSAELISTSADFTLGANWQASTRSSNVIINEAEVRGSPGMANSMMSNIIRIAQEKINISPNPAQDVLHFSTKLENLTITVFLPTGQILLDQHLTSDRLDISSLPTGMMYVKISAPQGIWTGSIVKIK